VVRGVTQLNDVVYVVCRCSSTVRTFSATTHQRLADIEVSGLRDPSDLAACEHTSRLYVADDGNCIWRVLSDGEDVKRWWTKSPSDVFRPRTLSVTSARLLVTSSGQLRQFDSAGNQLRCVHLPDFIEPRHAVESARGTFIVSHRNTQSNQHHVIEVSGEGQDLRQSSGSLGVLHHVAVDSRRNVFVADDVNRQILLLDAQLALRRVIADEHQLNSEKPRRLCYVEQAGQLLVGLDNNVAAFSVLRR